MAATIPGTVRAWLVGAAGLLVAAREDLDAANVFPVADHDTGTNLALTVAAAAEALAAAGDTGDRAAADAAALRTAAAAAVRAARGNSGALFAAVLRGFADAADRSPSDWDLAAGFAAAAAAARGAVGDPRDGTMLSVADAAAEAAGKTQTGPATVARAALLAARAAVARTPEQLSDLYGEPDAGARGLALVYEALAAALGADVGEPPPDPVAAARLAAVLAGPDHPDDSAAYRSVLTLRFDDPQEPGVGPVDREPGTPGYEVQYLLTLAPAVEAIPTVTALTAALRPLGDSLVVTGDGAGSWSVHVHVDDVATAVEIGARAVAGGGAMSAVRITRFADALHHPPPAAPPENPPARRAVVLADGADLHAARALFERVAGAEDDRSAVTVLSTVEPLPAGELVVVAVGPEASAVAMRHGDRHPAVSVVPTRAVVQAVAAVAVHDPTRRGVDDTVAMAEAAAACRYASLAVVTADALTIVGRARPGDVLGLLGDEVAIVGADPFPVAAGLIDRLLAAGGELVTVLHSTNGTGLAAALAAHVRRAGDHLDVETFDVGDEIASPVLLGVE